MILSDCHTTEIIWGNIYRSAVPIILVSLGIRFSLVPAAKLMMFNGSQTLTLLLTRGA